MERIIAFMENKENSHLLKEWLSDKYELIVADLNEPPNGYFDLGILDGPSLKRLWKPLQERKKAEEPTFLPYLFITPQKNIRLAIGDLWKIIDELVLIPIEKAELQVRLERLLRLRRLSIKLRQRNEDLEAMTQAVTHDLRAHMRVILGFTQAVSKDQADKLDKQGLHYLERIQSEAEAGQNLIDMLYDFLRLGREGVRKQPVSIEYITNICLSALSEDIERQKAQVSVDGNLPEVQADPTLLKLVLKNLLANAINYVAPDVEPRVAVSADNEAHSHRVRISDNGIGIAPENQERIFQPFVRLHGVEEYPGVGLGLSAVRKAVELMNGKIGVESESGNGSTFWFELPGNG